MWIRFDSSHPEVVAFREVEVRGSGSQSRLDKKRVRQGPVMLTEGRARFGCPSAQGWNVCQGSAHKGRRCEMNIQSIIRIFFAGGSS